MFRCRRALLLMLAPVCPCSRRPCRANRVGLTGAACAAARGSTAACARAARWAMSPLLAASRMCRPRMRPRRSRRRLCSFLAAAGAGAGRPSPRAVAILLSALQPLTCTWGAQAVARVVVLLAQAAA